MLSGVVFKSQHCNNVAVRELCFALASTKTSESESESWGKGGKSAWRYMGAMAQMRQNKCESGGTGVRARGARMTAATSLRRPPNAERSYLSLCIQWPRGRLQISYIITASVAEQP